MLDPQIISFTISSDISVTLSEQNQGYVAFLTF